MLIHISAVGLPSRVEESFKFLRYVSYPALLAATSSTVQQVEAESEELRLSASGTIIVHQKDSSADRNMPLADWNLASIIAEEHTRKHHGNERAEYLLAHNRHVASIAYELGWPIARDYDIMQRKLLAGDSAHDVSLRNTIALSTIMGKHQQAQITAALLANTVSVTNGKRPWTTESVGFNKHQHIQQPKKARFASSCFRCGQLGHLPARCSATTTVSGKPVLQLDPTSRGEHTLRAPDGKPVCIAWASRSTCSRSGCRAAHICSLCLDNQHGANACTAGRSGP